MGIFSRFKDIIESNVQSLLDKWEDPAKIIDQSLRNPREDLAEVKTKTAAVMADEKEAKRKLDECNAAIEKCSEAAHNALRLGNENDAKKLIAIKQGCEVQLTSLQQTYDMAHTNAEKLRNLHDKLAQDIADLEMRRDSIKAKVQVAKTQQKVNEIISGTANSEASIAAFERMEAKANKMLDQAEAEADLNAGVNTPKDLAAKYTLDRDASVNEEFARMKSELGL